MEKDGLKICVKCGEAKELTDFYVSRKSTGSRDRTCKTCRIAGTKKYLAENAELIRAKNRARYLKDPESAKQRAKAWRNSNPERVKAIAKVKRLKHADSIKAYRQQYEVTAESKAKGRVRGRRIIENLPKHYVASKLRIPADSLPQDLYEAKRFQILIMRHLKEVAE